MHISSIMTNSSSRTPTSATLAQYPWLVYLHMRHAVRQHASSTNCQCPGKDQARTHPLKVLDVQHFHARVVRERVQDGVDVRRAHVRGHVLLQTQHAPFRLELTRVRAYQLAQARNLLVLHSTYSVSATGQLIKQQWVHCCRQALSCSLQSICTSPIQGLWDREHLLSSTWVYSEVARKGALPVEGRRRARA